MATTLAYYIAVAFILGLIIKSLLLALSPNSARKRLREVYRHPKEFQAFMLIIGVFGIFFGMYGVPLENVMSLIIGFSGMSGFLMLQYPKELNALAEKSLKDKHLKDMAILGVIAGIYLLWLLLG